MEPRAGCFWLFRWLAFGNLNNGTGNGGLSNLNGNNTLGNANWNILARHSEEYKSIFSPCYLRCGENQKTIPRVSRRPDRPPIARSFSERVIPLHRLCKETNIKDTETVLPWVEDCVRRHWSRHDFRGLLIAHGMTRTQYYEFKDMIEARNLGVPEEYRDAFEKKLAEYMELYQKAVRSIAETACGYIASRNPKVRPVRIREREDKTTGKIRLIGCESAMQQVLDYIAVGAAMPIFERRIVPQQASSIPGRGQVYGVRMIRNWIQADDRAARYAKRHGIRYTRKCKYFVKLDIRKCYNSAKKEIFLRLFRRDCGNADLIWLWDWILSSHRVDGYEGFMIGALPSQWGAQYMLSFVYRFAKDLHQKRRGKQIQMVTRMILFMDDFALFSGSRKHLKKAVELIEEFMQAALGFSMKPGWHIRETAKSGIDMMGYVVHQTGKIAIRGRDFVRARRMAIRRLTGATFGKARAERTMSYKGFFDNSDSRAAFKRYDLWSVFRYAAQVVSAAARKANAEKRRLKFYVYEKCAV